MSAINPALQRLNDEVSVGHLTPAPDVSFNKLPKCRTLTANGVAPPLGTTPSVFELKTMIPSADGGSGIDPDIVRQLHEMAAQLKINEDTVYYCDAGSPAGARRER